MSSFTKAEVEPVLMPDGAVKRRPSGHVVYRLRTDFWFYLGDPADGRGFLVKAGTETDGPSWPYLLKRLLPTGLWNWLTKTQTKASYVHDAAREDDSLTKPEGDAVFLVAMYVEGTPTILRELSYVLVRFNRSRTKWNASLK